MPQAGASLGTELAHRPSMDNPNILDVIGNYVSLAPAGRSYKGLCSFHQEQAPSFYVQHQYDQFYCFSCGASGDAEEFLERYVTLVT